MGIFCVSVREVMSRLAVVLLIALIGAVACDHLGNFEGSYVFADGSSFYLCQDGTQVQGAYSELGLVRGGAVGAQMTGNFWSAGRGPCVLGTVELDYTDEGVEGTFVCNALPGAQPIRVTRVSNFRPTDSQCGIISESGASLEGKWINNDGLELDACFRVPGDRVDDETFQASLQRVNSDGVVVDWFLNGYWVDSGRIALGTWYQDLSAGAFMLYLRNNEQIDYVFWTGLLFDEGRTYIDMNQLNNAELHGTGTFKLPFGGSPAHQTTSNQCTRNEILQTLVLKNLHQLEDDDNYYYFVQTEYLDAFEYVKDLSSGAGSVLPLVALVASLIVVLF